MQKFKKIVPFIGRKQELEDLFRITSDQGSTAIISGAPGIGKTAFLRNFEQKYSSKFTGGIYHLTGEIGKKDIEQKLASLLTYNSINSNEHSLVVLDDIDLLHPKELFLLNEKIKNFKFVSLVLSGRTSYVDEYLKGINEAFIDLSSKRIHLESLKPEETKEVISSFIENAKRATTSELNISYEENITYKVDIQTENDKNTDYYGIAFSLILFVMAYISANNSEDRLTNELHELQTVITQQHKSISTLQKANNLHRVTSDVHFRKEPILSKTNIISVLKPDQIVDLVSVNKQWAKIKIVSSQSDTPLEGWVHTKYIEPK